MNVWLCVAAAMCAQDVPTDQAALLQTFREEFVQITPGAGKFPAAIDLEGARKVAPSGEYSIAKYEVPQNLYESVAGKNPSRWKGKRNSVEMVNYAEAVAFCEKATQLLRAQKLIAANEEIRLPTAAEWEYACRAGTTTPYSFGADASKIDDYAWHNGNAAGNDPPVGVKKPNDWGLYDMHGYIREWVAQPASEKENLPFLVYGGSWKDPPSDCRSDSKQEANREKRDDAIGFRCVLSKTTE